MTSTNKIILLIITFLNIKNNKYLTSKLIEKILLKIKRKFYNKSPIFIIEKALFNIMIPIRYNKNILNIDRYNYDIKGISLKRCLSTSIISIINKSKLERHKSIVDKLFFLFIKIYKKEHPLYIDKYSYLNKLLQK